MLWQKAARIEIEEGRPHLRHLNTRAAVARAGGAGLFILRAMAFRLGIDYQPKGDQPTAIDTLLRGLRDGDPTPSSARRHRFRQDITMAKVIQASWQRQSGAGAGFLTETLPAQLYQNIKELFPVPTQSSTLSATTTITSRKPTFPLATSTSKKKPRSTMN